jgi:hypothetical protein
MLKAAVIFLVAMGLGFRPAPAPQDSSPASAPREPKSDFLPTATMREVIQSMVVPQSAALFGAVSVTVSARETQTNYPQTDQEWLELRRQVITMAEASNLIVIRGRRVAKPGETAQDPRSQLSPEQIADLVQSRWEDWVKFSQDMNRGSMDAVKAIDDRDTQALTRAADKLIESCEFCHRIFWTPRPARRGGGGPRGPR